MVDFANGNLCGATVELNNVLSKLDEAKAEIKSKLDELASTATEAFLAKNNELSTLKSKLQTIVIPTVPKLNLQSEITSLLSQATGSAAYAVALAKVASEFKTDIEAKGLTLESLVTAAATASDLVCSVIPNLEKEAGSAAAAVEKPVAVKQAVEKAITEAPSKVWQNPDITAKLTSIVEKTANFKTTTTPPTADTPAFKFVPSSLIKLISIGPAGGTASVVVAPTNASERKNYVSGDKAAGFSYKKSTITEYFSVAGAGQHKKLLDPSGQLPLKHEPTGDGIKMLIYPGEQYTKTYIGSSFRDQLGLTEESSDANKQFYYQNYAGKHAAMLIYPGYDNPRTNYSIFGKTFIFSPPVSLSDHPGNLVSGGTHLDASALAEGAPGKTVTEDNFYRRGYEPFMFFGRGSYRRSAGIQSDLKNNKRYAGFSVAIRYEYLEKYDPDYKPA